MSAKISVGQVEITVTVSELGEAMRQLAPWLELPKSPSPPPAPPRRAAWAMPAPVAPPAAESQQEHDPAVLDDVAGAGPVEQGLSLFKAIRDHRASGGLSPTEVMRFVGTAKLKGIGSRMQSINRVLKDRGVDFTNVYTNNKGPSGERAWLPGRQIDEAIAALEGGTQRNGKEVAP